MTPCEERGWRVGDMLRVVEHNPIFDEGSVVQLYVDDGSPAPLLKLINGECYFSHAGGKPGGYLLMERLEKIEEREMIDFTKPVRTKSGEPVEIITTEGREPWPILGYIAGDPKPRYWRASGLYNESEGNVHNLENIPQKRSGWVNIYAVGESYTEAGVARIDLDTCGPAIVWSTKEVADGVAYEDRVACAYIEWTE